MNLKYTILFAFFLLIQESTFSQADSTTSSRRYFSYTYSNDFFDKTDQYYTQGINPILVLPWLRKLPLMKILPRLPNAVSQFGLSAVQDCFTPSSIRNDTVKKGDRPYAATIYLGHFIISNNEEKKQRLSAEIDLGVIGPCAVCEEEQKAIHKALVNIQPLGWEYQISDDVLLNYRMRFEHNVFSKKFIDFIYLAEFNAGTVYDNASLGANLRMGKMQGYFDNKRSEKFQLYGFAQGWVKGVAHNGTVQGGLFTSSINTLPYSELEPLILRGTLGVCLSFKNIYLEYARTFITPEIKQGFEHGWGHLNFTVYF